MNTDGRYKNCTDAGYRRVDKLEEAYAKYWSAKTRLEEHHAHSQILLFGGHDGYRAETWRTAVARTLRRVAAWIDG